MGWSPVVIWWQERQLRILVLGSLFLQWFLFLAAPRRKYPIGPLLRSFIWLAYLGSDALAIYALATLFNRQKMLACGVADGSRSRALEVFWVPILLIHLAGQDSITAYNIEDNELWKRHVLTVISQVTVAIYVFCKSWSGEGRLLSAAVLLFIAGILKCIDKPMALKGASIYSLVSSSSPLKDEMAPSDDQVSSLEGYIREAKNCYAGIPSDHSISSDDHDLLEKPYNLFVDLASTYCHRLTCLQAFLRFDEMSAYHVLESGLCSTFVWLYTKRCMYFFAGIEFMDSIRDIFHCLWTRKKKILYGLWTRLLALVLTFASIDLFRRSHTVEGYNSSDVEVTYTLLWYTAVLELFSLVDIRRCADFSWPHRASQYNLIAFFARDRKPTKLLKLARFFGCKDYVDQHLCVEQCTSSLGIISLVTEQVKTGWKEYIQCPSTYWMFNDRRGQFTIQEEGWDPDLCRTVEAPFDECVLVWHIATDICFYDGACASAAAWCTQSRHHQIATHCREISNYMFYLLALNPEMLMAGTRVSIVFAARSELENMFRIEKLPPSERDLTCEIYRKAQLPQDGNAKKAYIQSASKLASQLLAMDDEKRWRVIQGVWVEMLCFSASRCRGYLHAKSLGVGGEFLSYVWLLLAHLGMETVAERQQRSDFRRHTERGPSPSSLRTRNESSVGNAQRSEIQEEGAVFSEIQHGERPFRLEVQDDEVASVRMENREEEPAVAAAHASEASVPGDDNV
ncbi:unnamed protein product [Urochloa decumbens]|uniref:DUF4220 domain-containing protein n=1 Tax=Urochloa decumbens TaxID=240449 RepID=A0ABC9AHZ3_9POAL